MDKPRHAYMRPVPSALLSTSYIALVFPVSRMSYSVLDSEDLATLKYIVTHVFFPLQLPGGDDHNFRNDHSLAAAVASAARLYNDYVGQTILPEWRAAVQLLENLSAIVHTKSVSKITSQLSSMDVGDVIAFLIRAQNSAVIFRRQQDVTIFESFEVSPKDENVMAAQGKLVCSYPGPAIKVPNDVFDDECFRSELINFLVHMNDPDAATIIRQARSGTSEIRDPSRLRCITELLTGILRSVGSPADVIRISKRVGDDVVASGLTVPWRRSPIWLLIKVILQTLLYRSTLAHDTYKTFMLFFMCHLAQEKISADLPNDYIQAMSAKISRRLRKFGSSSPDWLTQIALQTCTSLRAILDERWRKVQVAQSASPVWAPSQLDLAQDTRLSLPKSGDYIRTSLSPKVIDSINASFHPKHHRRGTLEDFLSPDGIFFDEAYRLEPYITLYDVEKAVERGIDDWVDHVMQNDDACVRLEVLANKYSSSARKTYEKNPELLSAMLLTTIELWIALDKIAIKAIPMLADYSPEIPINFLERLLLSKATSLHRLCLAHQYLSHRHSQCRWSVFSMITADSLAVRFYQESSRLQCLKARIEQDAQLEVRQKVDALDRANDDHAKLQKRIADARHEYVVDEDGRKHHVPQCVKCSLRKESGNMRISIYEWPLPADQLMAEAVMFELGCPISFSMWRTATCHLLVDICSRSILSCPYYMLLSSYKPLQRYHTQHPRSQVTLATDSRPFTAAHYTHSTIPTTQEHVCVSNGLLFYGFYNKIRIPVWKLLDKVDISKFCKYVLPSGPYENFQKYLDTTSNSSNDVMANQADCHKDLSIHEYIAFAHLRSGGLLQWLNILREIRGRSLTFRRPEVHYLLAQAISQVGPLENLEWVWHQEIQHPPFCYALLGELENLVQDVKTNWLEGVTMDSVSLLLRRLLASNPDSAVSHRANELLQNVRRKVFSWVLELSSKLARTPGDKELRRILRDTAAICRSTFDVDPVMIPRLLYLAEDVEALVCSAVFIHDNTPAIISSLPAYSQLLLDRDCRISLALESALNDALQTDFGSQGLESAVKRVWPEYLPGSKWAPLQNPHSHWFSSTTALTAHQHSQEVHYNTLDGSLLVDRKPLGRLPNEIFQHPVYTLIFGEQVLDVIPSGRPGMDYSTRVIISGHNVHFALRKEDLVIQAKRADADDSEIFELIPQKKLEGDLPATLIEGHAHWLNLSTCIIEIRPLHNLWKSSSENWRIYCTPGKYSMRKGNECLVDIHSESWDMVSARLKPIEVAQNLIVSVSESIHPTRPSLSKILVSLPRYGLSFYVDEDGDIQSHNMRGMVYDEDQSIGTLFGLVNRLVLRPKTRKDHPVDLIPRCVLIPEGKISFRKDGHHVHVEIAIGGSALQRAVYQTYRADTDLGYLTGTVSLTSKLYRAYLHALTSGCGTDSLTSRHGTEEALSLLQSADCWSIIKFTSRDVDLLNSIASLCPDRSWQPSHSRCTQRVDWLDLPVNSQQHELYLVCKAIKDRYEKLQLFHENPPKDIFKDFPFRDNHLLERSARRTAYLFPHQSSSKVLDVHYPLSQLGVLEKDSGEHRAYTAAAAIYHRTANAAVTTDILGMIESWEGTIAGDYSSSLRYDKLWLISDLPLMWLKTYDLLRKSTDEEKWSQLLFSIPAMVYTSPELGNLVPVFLAFALHPQFRSEDPPSYDYYNISDGYCPSPDVLRRYVIDCAHSFQNSPEYSEHAYVESEDSEVRTDDDALKKHQLQTYRARVSSDADAAVEQLMSSWPCETLQVPFFTLSGDLYDLEDLISNVQNHFSSCHRNLKLKEHLVRVQNILNDLPSPVTSIPGAFFDNKYSFHPSHSTTPSTTTWSLTLDQLISRTAPSFRTHNKLPTYRTDIEKRSLSSPTPLRKLISVAETSAVNQFQRQYVSALRTSAGWLETERFFASGEAKLVSVDKLLSHYVRCKDHYDKALRDLKHCLGPKNQSEHAVEQSGQWPRITTYTLFRLLASNSRMGLSDDWKKCLTMLALIALELQRARRLLRLHFCNLLEELRRELENEGCDGRTAEAHPDWLLIQLQGDFLVRRVQCAVASEMISPQSGENTAMQLNMGEGKSSVIVPIVVATLADGKQLVRVIVPKALTMQMFHILVDRLAGLTNRPIFLVPFSRSLKVDQNKVAALRELVSKCMEERGVLVVQPEHILSLKLVTVEKLLLQEEDTKLAGALLELQRWLHSCSRDILDESDEVLHVRYQMSYTVGIQQHMEGFPERWTTTQQILNLVNKHSSSLQEHFRDWVEYERGPSGSFPHLRISHANAGEKLIAWIVQDIIDGVLPNFRFGPLRSGIRNAIQSFISYEDVSPTKARLVKDFSQKTSLWSGLLHLRGILASGILLFALGKRRWRVDYGLAPTRTMLAVPYRAKDVPAQRAEFGHPDISIILTCLSYYYGGLSEGQLRVSFGILLQQDDPSLDYDLWVRNCRVPESLRTLSGVNVKSAEQWKNDLFPLFSRNQATIDFYLSNVVFPKEAKEFPSRLSCSGWDLAEKKEFVLTGFSGTNDGRYLLPMHIAQCDLDHQRGTNARTLSYLLQPENKHYMCMSRTNGERRATREFLKILVAQKPPIRVLLDVGAQMLDLQNHQLAEAWLALNADAAAAIYFNEDDELTVRTRDGIIQLLLSSPFAQQLDQCVIYFDDAHTRGTDIKFPSGFRAAVTLGPKVTKDRLAQGCMRMRKLGHGHSIMFFAPFEIDRRIRSVAKKGPRDTINTMDILHWTMRETCDDIQQRASLWAQQGIDHMVRYSSWTRFCTGKLTPKELSKTWLQPGAKTLENLYEPYKNTFNDSSLVLSTDFRERCSKLGASFLQDISMDEEEERELVHEAENERQAERPPIVPPESYHGIHEDIVDFISTGIIPRRSKAFRPVFETLNTTSAITNQAHLWSPDVLATGDFEKTVKTPGKMDEYLRPVQWVVAGKEALVIFSPREANYFLPYFRSSTNVRLHIYTPRITRSMKPCDNLSFYSIPPVTAGWVPPSHLIDQLNIFAGQLYLKDYGTYIRLCRFLGVYARDLRDAEGIEVGCDGFIVPSSWPSHIQIASTFQETPLGSLKTLMGIRRKGMRFAPTHMGHLLDGRLLSEDDFDDRYDDDKDRQI